MGKYEYRGSITTSVNFDYFPYEVENENRITLEVIKDIIAPFREWEEEMGRCLEEYQQGKSDCMDRYGELQELYQNHDGYIIEELIEGSWANSWLICRCLPDPLPH